MQRHEGLDRLARKHSEFLRQNRGQFALYGKNVSHFGFEGRAGIARELYSMGSVSENVASVSGRGPDAVGHLVRLWNDSSAHSYTMHADWTYSGIGAVVDGDGTIFATQIFGNVANPQMMMRQRFTGY